MEESQFTEYIGAGSESYAQDIARNYKRPIDQVRVEAKNQLKSLLPKGMQTERHFFYDILDRSTNQRVGSLWVNLEPDKRRAFLYDFIVKEEYRGKGYGRRALSLLETTLRGMGVENLGLHVFADNQVAIHLYERQGFRIASFNMDKEL